MQIDLNWNHLRRLAQQAKDARSTILRNGSDHAARHCQLKRVINVWDYGYYRCFRHGRIRGAKAQKRMAESIDTISITERYCSRCGQRIITAHKLDAYRTAGRKSIRINRCYRCDGRGTTCTRNRQEPTCRQLWTKHRK